MKTKNAILSEQNQNPVKKIMAWYRHFNKNGGVKLVSWTQTSAFSEIMRSCK